MTHLQAFWAYVRRRRPLWAVYPTRRLAAVTLAGAVLWLVPGVAGRWFGWAGVVAIVVLVGVDQVFLPGRRSFTLTREAPETVGLGDPMRISYRVTSNWWAPAEVVVYHAVPAALDADLGLDPVIVTRDSPAETVVAATATARGRHELGEAALRVTTRLGLLARLVHVPLTGSLLVVPSLANVRKFRLLAHENRLTDAGVRALRVRGEGRSFAGLRDYVPGDDHRTVDWKATARHGRMITREFTIERSQTVMVLVDCGRSMTQMSDGYARLEHVLTSALLLTDVAAAGGDYVGMLAFDDQVRSFVAPRRGRAAIKAVREGLTGLSATLTEPDYGTAFRFLATRQRRRALLVFYTDMIDERASRSLIAYLARSTSRHSVVVVAIRNEELIAASQPSTAGALALYLSAAAEELVRERAEALAHMTLAGVAVLDVAPTQMAPAVVNRYLEVKARGLL